MPTNPAGSIHHNCNPPKGCQNLKKNSDRINRFHISDSDYNSLITKPYGSRSKEYPKQSPSYKLRSEILTAITIATKIAAAVRNK